MRLGTDYDSNVLTASTTITITIHFVLRVLSAEFQTSKSEARHWRMSHKLPLLDSYLHNLPNSANKYLYYLKQWKDRRFQVTKTRQMFYIMNSGVMQVYLIFIDFKLLRKIAKTTNGFVLFVCPSVRSALWNNSSSSSHIWKLIFENL